jgi:hypothetical protein
MITITPVPATASTLPATGPTPPAANPPLDALRSQIAALVQQYADIAYAPQPFVPGVTPVPVSGKVIGARELQYMVDASLDGWLTTGRFNAAFEARLARFARRQARADRQLGFVGQPGGVFGAHLTAPGRACHQAG